ncbi:MAG: hypothetical protein HY662_02855 [Chloroflexi bacterium]|jgi:hypothetical protein|nr:hypothetical protein [Chloroflexota bacterium]
MNRSNAAGTKDWLNVLEFNGIQLRAYVDKKEEQHGSAAAHDLSKLDSEVWLLKSKFALESVCRGIRQAKNGELIDCGSFAHYADDEIE